MQLGKRRHRSSGPACRVIFLPRHELFPLSGGEIARDGRAHSADEGAWTAAPEDCIPQPHGLVVAGRGEGLAVTAERDAAYRAGVALEGLAQGAAGGDVPQPRRIVLTGRGEGLAVTTERDSED